MKTKLTLLALAFAASASLTQAVVYTINVDFNNGGTADAGATITAGGNNTTSGAAFNGVANSGTWNNIPAGGRWVGFNSLGQLANNSTSAAAATPVTAHTNAGDAATTRTFVDSTNTAQTITAAMSITNPQTTGTFGLYGSGFAPGDSNANFIANIAYNDGTAGSKSVMRDYLFVNNATGRSINLTLGALNTQVGVTGYKLTLFGAGDAVGQGGSWSVTGGGTFFSKYFEGGDNTTAQAAGTTLTAGEDYVVAYFDATEATRTITLSTTGTTAAFNGFQLVAIPEPSSIALLGMGALALCGVRRRK